MSKETVTVACKMPHGLILRLFNFQEVQEPLPGGGTKSVERAQPETGTVRIRGYLDKYDPSLPPVSKVSSYALTPGVNKEWFEEWLDQNEDLDLVKNHLIFVHDEGMVREFEGTKNGLEPVDPTKLKGRVTAFNPKPDA